MRYIGIPIRISKEDVVIKCSDFNRTFKYDKKLLNLLMNARTNEIPCEVEIDYGCIIVSVQLKS